MYSPLIERISYDLEMILSILKNSVLINKLKQSKVYSLARRDKLWSALISANFYVFLVCFSLLFLTWIYICSLSSAFLHCSSFGWYIQRPGGGDFKGSRGVSLKPSKPATLFMTKIAHFATLSKTRDHIFRPWFVSFCIQN